MIDSGNMFSKEPYFPLAAKYSAEQGWLPFYAHLLDTAGVMERLLHHWLPANIIENILAKNPAADLEKLCVFCALTHDLGKAVPVFQAKICEQACILKNRIASFGIALKESSSFLDPGAVPHSYAGEAILLRAGCPAGIAAVVGAHHGKPFSITEDPLDIFECYEENFYGSQGRRSSQGHIWEEIWGKWICFALAYCGYRSIEELPEPDVPAQMLISGLLVMADWIASNGNYASLLPLEDTGSRLLYPKRIDEIWEKLSFPDQWMSSCWFMDEELFQEKYGFPPNGMQQQMIRAAEGASDPGIYILEAPMGLGKTEAALCAAEILAAKWQCEGLFFGLPTQATANGIFPRLMEWAERQSEGVRLSIRLAHGMAMLQKGYRDLFYGRASRNEDASEGLVVHSWFEGRRQALLSSFVAGTVDQLLMAALQQKYVMLRHLGIAGKIVVIDECHAYDAYMNCYLKRALTWLGEYRVPVILLSATLPAQRRAELIEAYHGKAFVQEPDGWRSSSAYPLLTYTDAGELRQCVIPLDGCQKEIQMIRGKSAETGKFLKKKLAAGGCAGVILNTVSQAQETARQLREQLPEATVLLVHARFTMADRQKKKRNYSGDWARLPHRKSAI